MQNILLNTAEVLLINKNNIKYDSEHKYGICA